MHHEIKRLIRIINMSSKDLDKELRKPNIAVAQHATKKNLLEKGSQTIPDRQSSQNENQTRLAKRKLDTEDKTTGKSPKAKKNKESSHKAPSTTSESVLGDPEAAKDGASNIDSSGWTTVTKRKDDRRKYKNKKPIRTKSKNEAIMIGSIGDTSYADILKQVKNDPKLKNIGDNVAKIRRTQKGELLLELKKDSTLTSSVCKQSLDEALKDLAKIKALSPEATLELKDLDEVTTEDEICQSLKDQFDIVASVRSLRKAYGGTQTAVISLAVDQANALLSTDKVKISWTVCRVREVFRPLKCFKCLDYGHVAAKCKDTDRTNLCRRCGQEGHFYKKCDKPPKCVLCTGDDGIPQGHITGSGRCPAFQRALTKSRNRS